MSSFSLKKPSNDALFGLGGVAGAGKGDANANAVTYINVNKLRHYRNHPFKLYEGEQQAEMVESIREYGILTPISVVSLKQGEDGEIYEVYIGHNRLECAKLAGLTEIPCIIRRDLTDDEVAVFVRISNLLQRGFSDLPHSERAEAIATYYNAIKSQGKRTDLLKQVEVALKDDTSGGQAEDAKNKYGLSKNSIARYVRIDTLNQGFKELLDTEELSIRAGVSLSYLNEHRQRIVLEQMQRYDTALTMEKAKALRVMDSETAGFDDKFALGCADILTDRQNQPNKPKKTIKLKLERAAVASYFGEDDTEEQMQTKILEALEFYHRNTRQKESE